MLALLRKKIAVTVIGLLLVLAPAAVPAVAGAGASIDEGLTCGADFTLSLDGDCEPTETGTSRIQEIIELVVNIFSIIVGIVAVIMIIYGGFKYITSGGDSGNITTAKNTIIYAIIGLVIVALAQFLVQFVLNQVIEE
jgi:hypothetical protein